MKKSTLISSILILTLLLLWGALSGCKETIEPNIAGERSSIESYINGLNDSEIIYFGEYKYDHDLRLKTGVYRVVHKRESTVGRREIIKGDSVEFWYVAEHFVSSPRAILRTNIGSIADALQQQQGLNISDWTRETEKVKLGSSPLLNGVRKGLEGCYEGDSIRLLLTSNLAFGNNFISVIPQNSTLTYRIIIDRVVVNKP